MKLYLIVFLALALFTVHQQLNASGGYNPPPPVVTNTALILSSDHEGVASAIAAGQCQFDWTHDMQGCLAGGTYDGNDAVSFQLGQRYKKVLINGGINYESGEYSAGIAVNWKFKR